jgi:hypothetical protein
LIRGSAAWVPTIDAHEIESIWCEDLLPLGYEMEIIDPELTTDRTSFRQPPDVEYQEFAILAGGEFAGCGFPETWFFQFVAFIQDGLGIRVLNRKMGAARALEFSIFVPSARSGSRCGLMGTPRSTSASQEPGVDGDWPLH